MGRGREEELVREFQAGKTDVFDRLMSELQGRAFSLAYYWTGSREDALDLVQEAFVRLWKTLPSWKPRAGLYTWLYRVIINLAKDRFREAGRRGEVPIREGALGVSSPGPGPAAEAAARETGEMIVKAVAALPPRQKEVFILRHYQNLSIKEIARVQGTTPGAAKANLFQALVKLRELLKPRLEGGGPIGSAGKTPGEEKR